MAYYEKCGNNEIFVGNITNYEKEKEKLNKKGIKFRIGKIAYDIHGEKLSNGILPLFIIKESYQKYDDMKMEELREIRKQMCY